MFFVFDGVDGAGKSTQLNLFASWLRDRGLDVVCCSDPGTTQLGNQMRSLLLGNHEVAIHMRSEMLMFMTARCQLVEELIRPALASGKTVVCDRYVYSTVVYQGHAGDLNPDDVWQVNQIATGGLMADMTFIFDLDVETVSQRLGESRDRMESRGTAYFQRVRDGFLSEAKRWPELAMLVDASGDIDSIQATIRTATESILENTLG
ncbi:MAG: dTMP kinase [Mariniblastus sp.]|nr:dTMP kinase [Mariniblastus sp.]